MSSIPRPVRLALVAILGVALAVWAMWPAASGSRPAPAPRVPPTGNDGEEADPHLRGSPSEGAPPAVEIADADAEDDARQRRLQRSLASGTQTRVLEALNEITRAGPDDAAFVGDVIVHLKSEDPKILRAAASALVAIGSSAVEPLIEAINADAERLGRTPPWALGWASWVMTRIGPAKSRSAAMPMAISVWPYAAPVLATLPSRSLESLKIPRPSGLSQNFSQRSPSTTPPT